MGCVNLSEVSLASSADFTKSRLYKEQSKELSSSVICRQQWWTSFRFIWKTNRGEHSHLHKLSELFWVAYCVREYDDDRLQTLGAP